MNGRHLGAIFGSGLLIVACSSEGLDVGSNRGPTSLGGGSGSGGSGGDGGTPDLEFPVWPDPSACAAESDLPMAGVWELNSPNDTRLSPLRVTIGGTVATGLCGTVTWGHGELPPPATDPDVGYPSEAFDYPPYGQGWGGGPSSWGPLPGYAYAIRQPEVGKSRAVFTISLNELWKGWCALQTPIQTDVGYRCVPNRSARGGTDGCFLIDSTGAEEPIDCLKLSLCGFVSVCACDADECGATEDMSSTLDMQFDGDEAWTTLNGANVPILLRRVQP